MNLQTAPLWMSPYWTMASLKMTRHFQHSCPSYLLRLLTLLSSPQQPQTSPSSMATVCQIPIPLCHTFILIFILMSYLYTLPMPSLASLVGVTIGFQQGSYSVSKHQGYVTLKVKVLQGMFGRTVSLCIQTSDGSAIGEL